MSSLERLTVGVDLAAEAAGEAAPPPCEGGAPHEVLQLIAGAPAATSLPAAEAAELQREDHVAHLHTAADTCVPSFNAVLSTDRDVAKLIGGEKQAQTDITLTTWRKLADRQDTHQTQNNNQNQQGESQSENINLQGYQLNNRSGQERRLLSHSESSINRALGQSNPFSHFSSSASSSSSFASSPSSSFSSSSSSSSPQVEASSEQPAGISFSSSPPLRSSSSTSSSSRPSSSSSSTSSASSFSSPLLAPGAVGPHPAGPSTSVPSSVRLATVAGAASQSIGQAGPLAPAVGGAAARRTWRGRVGEGDLADIFAIAFNRAGRRGCLKRIILKHRDAPAQTYPGDNEQTSPSAVADFIQGASSFCYRCISDVFSRIASTSV
eukprot:GHVT01030543.1.p1 GENE.GHVT01030543.1~~GHVT01030543.1.p1  ORF type:complete len:380 (-),score=125.63 GHVT01030543.1:2148-3287(-)